MSTKDFKKRALEGDKDALELMQYTLVNETLIDLFEGINEGFIKALEKNNMIGSNTRVVNFFMKALKELSFWQKQYTGKDEVANTMANKADAIQDLLLKIILMPNEATEKISEFANTIEIQIAD